MQVIGRSVLELSAGIFFFSLFLSCSLVFPRLLYAALCCSRPLSVSPIIFFMSLYPPTSLSIWLDKYVNHSPLKQIKKLKQRGWETTNMYELQGRINGCQRSWWYPMWTFRGSHDGVVLTSSNWYRIYLGPS